MPTTPSLFIPGGLLIAFDGIDGGGKTTHASKLAETLNTQGYTVVTTKEPTNGQWGSLLRASAHEGRKKPEEELELFLKDRAEHVETKIKPALTNGEIVIIDRYYFSTIAYQGARGLDPELIRTQNEAFAPKPDRLFILDIPLEEALNRITIRDGQGNAFEGRENLSRCKTHFDALSDSFLLRVDSTAPSEKVEAIISTDIKALIESKLT